MASKRGRAARWLWPAQRSYTPDDRTTWLTIAGVGIVAIIVVVQIVLHITSPAHRAATAAAPVTTTTAPAPRHVAEVPISPQALQVLQSGAEAQVDGDWTGVSLAPGANRPASTPVSGATPQILNTQVISSTTSAVVEQILVEYHNQRQSILARAQLDQGSWVYVPS